MRLLKHQAQWVPQFTQVWKVEYLAEQGEQWSSFCRVGEQEPIGSIHALIMTQFLGIHKGEEEV